MARRRDADKEEYEEEYEGNSWVDAFSSASWRPAIVVPLILILFGGGAWMMWKRYREEVLGHPSYLLDPLSIQVTETPDYLQRDIRAEAVKLGSLESKRIHEQGLVLHVVSAFEHHPWVKKVERVVPYYPAKLRVDLTYRKPVAMVALPDDDPNDNEAWMCPIDEESVVLPHEDFTPQSARSFPRIDVGNTEPAGPDGTAWGDDMVADAAKIAELLYEDWGDLKEVLYQIERSSQSTSTSNAGDFDIRGRPGATRPGLLIRWGRAPGKEQVGEPTAKVKLEALKKWVNAAKLSSPLPPEIDLRSQRSLQSARLGGATYR